MFRPFINFCARNGRLIALACALIGILFPLFVKSPFIYRMATISLMYVLLAQGLNFIIGFMGQMSFGHSAFWGIGAYVAAILSTRFGVETIPILLCAVVISGLFGMLLGLPVLKLSGSYLTIVTLGFCEIIRLVELNWMSLTRGPLGIMNIPAPSFLKIKLDSPTAFYYLILAMVIGVTFLLNNIINSRFGTAVLAIRDNELAAEAMGVNVFKYKVITFSLSAMVAGLAGAFYAQYMSYIDPTSFTSAASTEMIVMVIFGGLGNIVGPFVGAIALTLLPELLRGLMEYRMLIYGGLMVILMLAKPDGLFGKVNFKYIRQELLAQKGAQMIKPAILPQEGEQ